MISNQRSGPPTTLNVTADSDGQCVRMPSWTTSVNVRVKSPTRIYWNQKDFDADKNGIDLSGDEDDQVLCCNAAVANLWIRGLGSTSSVTLTVIGIG